MLSITIKHGKSSALKFEGTLIVGQFDEDINNLQAQIMAARIKECVQHMLNTPHDGKASKTQYVKIVTTND